ncbi:MAG TPA: DUF3429 domain-containing protein [Burkholderiaceae bacterium]
MSATLVSPVTPHPVGQRLAYWGLLPFVLGTALVWLLADYNVDAHAYATLCLSVYAGVVLALLGGIHWGLAMHAGGGTGTPFVWGAVPALLGGIATIMPAYAGLVIQGVLLAVCYLVDRRLYLTEGASAWLTLRFRLSAVATLCCFLAAAGV